MHTLRHLLWPLLFLAAPALACKCAPPRGSDAERASYGFVEHALVGVMEVTQVDRKGVVAGVHQNGLVELTLRENFKGSWLPNRPYLASTTPTSCGVNAKLGELWLVYADASDALELSQCSKSAPLLQRLGQIGTLFDMRERAKARAEGRPVKPLKP